MVKTTYALVGMPGAGKSEIVKVGHELKIPIIAMGDVVRQELNEKGIEVTPEKIGEYALEIRKKFGKDIVAKKTYNLIEKMANDILIIDGLRNIEEIEYFKSKIDNFFIIAIHASPKTRFLRLQERKRQDDSIELNVFTERDKREIMMGIAEIIVLADFMIINEGGLKKAQEEFKKIILKN